MIIKENGKLYNIDEETGLVTEASDIEEPSDVIEADELAQEFRTGDRVAIGDEEGTIISIISSIYGPSFGIRFDDGSIDEFLEDRLAHVETSEPDWETPVKEVIGKYSAYQELPSYTRDEIESKMAVARDLNLRAKALITDSKLSLSDQIELDRIVLATGTDLLDFKAIRDSAEANKEYMDQFEKSRFELAGDFQTGASVGATDDISWVNDYFTDIEETTDADLAVAATEMVNNLSIEQLQDETVLQISSAFRLEGLAATEEQAEKFVKYVKASAAEKLANYEPVENEESLPDLDDFDTSSLYL